MDSGEQPLTKCTVEEFLLNFVYAVARPEAITMADQQTVLSYLEYLRFPVYRYAQFFREVIKHPHVVISGKERDRNSFVAEFGEFALESDESFWDGVGVFEPEIKDVAKKKYRVRIMPDSLKPGYDPAFALQAVISIGCTQVKVGGEV